MRRAYQDQQAAGLMSLEELRERLGDLEDTRRMARAELKAVNDRQERIRELERDRDALLEHMIGLAPEALDNLPLGERNELYRVLRLQVTPVSEGYAVCGAFCSSDPLQTPTATAPSVPSSTHASRAIDNAIMAIASLTNGANSKHGQQEKVMRFSKC